MIARPTERGFTGVYVHWDGYPSHQLPLLLSAYQHNHDRDHERLAHHLVDSVKLGWSALGTDLLDGAPEELRSELAGAVDAPSRELAGIAPANERVTVDETSTDGLEWAYVLWPHGIEVISLTEHHRGPLVPWDTDPRSHFYNYTTLWSPSRPAPTTTPTITTTPHPAPVKPTSPPTNAAGHLPRL